MKKIIAFILLVLFLNNQANSQNLLSLKWKFEKGDNLEWSKPGFKDSLWKEIFVGDYWENQGLENYDGFAWYRKTLVIPSKLKAEAVKNGGFLLNLAKIDDADETYFNGKQIGHNGEMPPHYKTAYDALREYNIPVEKILWDKPNTIAVRVYDDGGNGGIKGEPLEFKVKGTSDNFILETDFGTSNRIFVNTPKIILPLQFINKSESCSGKVLVNIQSDFKESVATIEKGLKIGKGKVVKMQIPVENLKPGFYRASVIFESETIHKKISFNFGVDPEKIVSPIERQPDFENYWNRARKELAAVDPQFKLIKKDSLSTGTKDVYLLEMRSLGNVLIRGWYCVPKKAGKYPAILQVQGYSSNQEASWRIDDDDFINLVLNIRGHGNSKDDVNPGFPGYLQYFIQDKELYIYRGAYMDCIRAVDFLYSRKEVDTTRVVVEGGSQGGALSFATAALDNQRIRLCAPQVPFLSDFKDYFKVANWPGNEFVDYVAKHPSFGWDGVFKTLSYIDIKNLAPWIKAPVLMGFGLMDETCPPHINFAAYNQLTVSKNYIGYPLSGHGLPADFRKQEMIWIRKNLGMAVK
jgi:cephalosporin-C deacetylase